MRIAALSAADAPRYRALMLHAYAAAADAFTSTAEERAAEPESWWVARIADPTGLSQAFGAFDGEELVGTVTIEFSAKPKTRHKALLIGMFVREAARGRGVGKALVRAALAAAAARPGVQVVTLMVTRATPRRSRCTRPAASASSSSSRWRSPRPRASGRGCTCGFRCAGRRPRSDHSRRPQAVRSLARRSLAGRGRQGSAAQRRCAARIAAPRPSAAHPR